ncbi:hypothetical protein TRVL_02138 [Trypanosoma vivax]|nr:hypothetical protein TRVL_02138 [Trypanosoma vivax]
MFMGACPPPKQVVSDAPLWAVSLPNVLAIAQVGFRGVSLPVVIGTHSAATSTKKGKSTCPDIILFGFYRVLYIGTRYFYSLFTSPLLSAAWVVSQLAISAEQDFYTLT